MPGILLALSASTTQSATGQAFQVCLAFELLDKEIFSDIAKGKRYHADLVVKALCKNNSTFFLIHVEPQAQDVDDFPKRMFRYFCRLYERHDLRVYPIAVLSFNTPETQPCSHEVEFPDLKVLRFEYKIIQLSALDYKEYLKHPNPVAVALAGKMNVAPDARPQVKLECMAALTNLTLDPARLYLISEFIDTYLKLSKAQESEFQSRLASSPQKEEIMEKVTSWKREGIKEGLRKGRAEGREEGREEGRAEGRVEGHSEGQRHLTQILLQSRFGPIETSLQSEIDALPIEQLETLAKALLNWTTVDELHNFLKTRD